MSLPDHRRIWIGLALWASALLAGCANSRSDGTVPESPEVARWQQWQAKRRESVAGTNGWATLAGLHWLEGGISTAGRNPTNAVALQPATLPEHLGRFIRSGQTVRFEAEPGAKVLSAGRPVDSLVLAPDLPGPATILQVGAVRLSLIARGEHGERLGIRVRDPDSPARRQFHGLKCFPYNPAWRLEARFEPHPSPRTIRLNDVTGGIELEPSPGAYVFQVNGVEYRLDAVEEPDERDYFVIFRDTTAGHSTYGSGRFVYVPRPDATGRAVLDFNFAYNPPCAFTPFATCPLPPSQNRLPFAIEAGELRYGDH